MKNNKIIMYVSIILIIIIIASMGYFVFNNIKKKNKNNIIEYIPEEEITQEQFRQTIITLYFLNPETNKLSKETRQIDSKELLNNPYELLIKLLIEGPKNSELIKLIPEKTNLINVKIENNILKINFSKEFIEQENLGKQTEELIVKSIVNTLTELTEVNQIMILIEGEENKGFLDNELMFDKVFVRE